MAVHAMRAGAVDFVQKPFSEQALLDRIHQALDRDAKSRALLKRQEEIVTRFASLTPREREVMMLVIGGKANKVIASELGVSERTVEIHRARVMHKTGAESLPHLVRLALQAE